MPGSVSTPLLHQEKKKKCRESTCVGVHTRVCETESCHPPPKPGRPSYPGRLSHGDCPHPQVPQWHVPDGSLIKNLPAVQEMQVQCLGREDPLEEEMATHSSMLAWRILWTEEPGGLQSIGSQRVTRLSAYTTNRYSISSFCL